MPGSARRDPSAQALSRLTLRNYRSIGNKGVEIDLRAQFTAFVGKNNSGKTTVLKALYELRPLFQRFAASGSDIAKCLTTGYGQYEVSLAQNEGERIAPAGREGVSPTISLGLDFGDIYDFTFKLAPDGGIHGTVKVVDIGPIQATQASYRYNSSDGAYTFTITTTNGRYTLDISHLLNAFKLLSDTFYVPAFRNQINAGGGRHFDLEVGNMFVQTFDAYQAGSNPVENDAIAEMVSQVGSLLDIPNLQAFPSSDNTTLIFRSGGRAFRSGEMGAGLSQLIMVATNVLIKRPQLLLIDEPELNLHASLQVRFLTLLARYTQNSVLYSTHSYGLAHSVADRIIAMSRDAEGNVQGEDWRGLSNASALLGALGYGGFSDNPYQGVLLVEGVNDVRTLQEILIHYGVTNELVIIPLGGDDLAIAGRDIELADIRRLSSQVFALADSEAESPSSGPSKRRKEFAATCDRLGIKCHLTEFRAIENYLDQAIAAQEMGVKTSTTFGRFDKPWPGWSKSKNWRVGRLMGKSPLDGTDLDHFLADVALAVRAD